MAVRLSADARCSGLASKAWYGALRLARRKEVSLREIVGFRHNEITVAAAGGNSIGELQVPTIDNLLLFRSLVVTHGNGPQVGELVLKHPDWTLNKCVRQTQDDIGEALRDDLLEKLEKRGRTNVSVQVIPTRVIVSANDPAFRNPTKPVGRFYSGAEMRDLGACEEIGKGHYVIQVGEAEEWHVKEIVGASDPTKPFRRVVASPKPIEIHPEDLVVIKEAAREGNIAIACGGGGVPYAREADGTLKPVDAVIDKDLASALLASDLKARELIISTGVKRVAHNFGTDNQEEIDYFLLRYAMKNLNAGQYPPGSMGEKVEAAINALRRGVNLVMITHPNEIWIKFEGTLFTRGLDLGGRWFNAGRIAGNWVEEKTGQRPSWLPKNELQRWLVAD